MFQFVRETWAKNPIRLLYALDECWAIANLSGRDKAGTGFSDSCVQFLCSQPKGYPACPLKYSLNTNKVAICELQSYFVRKHVIRRQENSFFCYVRQVANSCVAELTAELLEPGRQDWYSFIYM